MEGQSLLYRERLKFLPKLPEVLKTFCRLIPKTSSVDISKSSESYLQEYFPHSWNQQTLVFSDEKSLSNVPKRVGVVLSGGQAPGGHNVIIGLHDTLQRFNAESRLLGFLGGFGGILRKEVTDLTTDKLDSYRNTGGFDLIGSGRAKIETPEQMAAVRKTVQDLQLDGLVIIGGDDSNTNAAFLAEYFLSLGEEVSIIGVPKTIDGDLKNEHVEASFGFDTACKVYSELIGNVLRDALSAKKYYHFIKLMGRSASHITLECALQTHPNMAIIGEEIAHAGSTLQQVAEQICDMICARAKQGKNYGIVLVSEGVVEFIPEFKVLISELNDLLAREKEQTVDSIVQKLSGESKNCFLSLPKEIQMEMLLDRDPHGNVQVSKIETERLLIMVVHAELLRRRARGEYSGKFAAQPHFFGYEARSGFPSNFDCQYSYALGAVSALLIDSEVTGYMSCVRNLASDVEQWQPEGIPLTAMMTMERRQGKLAPVIKKTVIDLEDKPFQIFAGQRERWKLEDDYRYPGPIQFFGPCELTDSITFTLQHQKQGAKSDSVKMNV